MLATRRVFSLPIRNFSQLIDSSDVVKSWPESGIDLIQVKEKHIPILNPLLRANEQDKVRKAGFPNIKIEDDWLNTLLYNYSRYPFSYFGVDKNKKPILMTLFDVAYKNSENEPLPRKQLNVPSDDEYSIFGRIEKYAEGRVFEEKPHLEKIIVAARGYTIPEYRKMKVMTMLGMYGLQLAQRDALAMGFEGVSTLLTSEGMAGFVGKQKRELYDVPDSLYKKFDGTPFSPSEDPNFKAKIAWVTFTRPLNVEKATVKLD